MGYVNSPREDYYVVDGLAFTASLGVEGVTGAL